MNAVALDLDPKAWASIQARGALAGWQLTRTDPRDGPPQFFALRWGRLRPLASLEACEAFLRQVGAAGPKTLNAVRADTRFMAAQARMALAGSALEAIEGDDGNPRYRLSVGDATYECPSASDIEKWLDWVEAEG